jgi:hypothetical protein
LKKIILGCGCSVMAAAGLSQTVRSPLTAPYTSIGAYSQNFCDVFSFTGNQAALAQGATLGAAVYTERKFMLAELGQYQAAIQVPLKKAGVGIALHHAGNKSFSESQIGLAYALALGEQVAIGAQCNYNLIHIATYGNSNAVNFELGTIWHVTKQVHMGLHLYNPIGGKFGKGGSEKLAAVYKAGIGYEATEQFFVSTEIAKEEGQRITVLVGAQYQLHAQCLLRAGITTSTADCFVGAGLKWKVFRVDIIGRYHAQLGFTPALQVIFNTPKKQKT